MYRSLKKWIQTLLNPIHLRLLINQLSSLFTSLFQKMKARCKRIFSTINLYKKRRLKKKQTLISGIHSESNIFLYQTPKNHELFNPNLLKTISTLLIIILFSFIAMAALTTIKEAAIASGEIEPEGNIIKLQHFDGGIVTKIYVHEGDSVEKGDIILTLDGIGAKEDLSRFITKNFILKLQAERISSILHNRKPNFIQFTSDKKIINTQMDIYRDMIQASVSEKAIIKEQISQQEYQLQSLISKEKSHKREIKIAERIVHMYKTLSNGGHSSKLKLLEEERRLIKLQREHNTILFDIKKIEKSVQEYKSRLSSYSASREDTLNKKLEDIEAAINENNEQISKLSQKAQRLNLRSPVSGIIKSTSVNALGEVVRPNNQLFEIVPHTTPLIATLHISPNDIGHVKAGDLVRVKVSAYDYIKYGVIEGNIYHISAGTFNDDNGAYYKGKVKLVRNYIEEGPKKHYLMPGMLIKAEIVTGNRTILEYLLKPIYRSINGGMVER